MEFYYRKIVNKMLLLKNCQLKFIMKKLIIKFYDGKIVNKILL